MTVQIDFNVIAQWLGGAAMSLACLIFLLVLVGLTWYFIRNVGRRAMPEIKATVDVLAVAELIGWFIMILTPTAILVWLWARFVWPFLDGYLEAVGFADDERAWFVIQMVGGMVFAVLVGWAMAMG